MPTERIEMRRVREILRLVRDAGVPVRAVARQLGVAPSTVRETLRRFEASGVDWPLPPELTDGALEVRLYGVAGTKQGHRRRAEPDWAAINRELKRKHVTLQILWDEYIELHPDGYRYSRFCELYRSWEARLPVTMRQTHLGGDRMFVDYAGDTVPVVVNRLTGEIREAHIFVAVMGASSLSFAWASWTESLPDWVDAHVRAFAYFGGSARLLIPDNAKIAVIKACLYDPHVNRSYAELAAHYGAAVLAARPYRPRDKAKVRPASASSNAGYWADCVIGSGMAWVSSTRPLPICCAVSTMNGSCAGSGAHGALCSRNWMRRCSSRCRPNPMSWRNGAVHASGSIIMSKSKSIFTRCPIATRAPLSKCG